MVIEVFKTDVLHADQARMLLDKIHVTFRDYRANFDLEDCDRILRVAALSGKVLSSDVVALLNDFGFHAEILSDDIPALLQF